MSTSWAPQLSEREAVNPPACMTPGCSSNCAMGYSCHEQRLGRGPVIGWPMIVLGLVAVAAIFV